MMLPTTLPMFRQIYLLECNSAYRSGVGLAGSGLIWFFVMFLGDNVTPGDRTRSRLYVYVGCSG